MLSSGKVSHYDLTSKFSFKLIDLYAGAGGLTLGFVGNLGQAFQLGSFEVAFANDFDKNAIVTYNTNFGQHCILGDINELLNDRSVVIPRADVVIGGPPCQGFSLLNKKKSGDTRRELWRPFFEVVKRSKADVFVMENVPELLSSEEYNQIISLVVHNLGFKIAAVKLCAADYGVAQIRWRAFIVGCRFADPASKFPPKKTYYPRGKTIKYSLFEEDNEYVDEPLPWRTVRDAIGDLPEPSGTQIRKIEPPLDLHFGRSPTPQSIARYKAIPEEGMNRFDLQRIAPELTPQCWIKKEKGGTDLFGRLWWDKQAFTIRTEFYKPEKGRYLHPVQHRPITHREAARLQSFPDTFRFCSSKIEIAKQIGNAVPPLLAARIAESVYQLLLEREAEPHNNLQTASYSVS
ncbi:MAG: DNA cytosine methyltransferase [Chloroflexi bacterium]|nr:DNA cytosine methyltransferase [Chloroflexota bacterium]